MVKRNGLQNSTPSAVEKTIKGLGENLRTARLRRKLTIKEVADKIGVGIRVVSDAEHGKPATSIKVYMALLWVYDLLEPAADLANPLKDEIGLRLASLKDPKRSRNKETIDNDF